MAENTMTPEQVIEKMQTIIAEKTAGFVKPEDIDGLKSDLATLKEAVEKSNQTEALKSAIAKLEGQVEGLKEAPKSDKKALSLKEAISLAYTKSIDAIKSLAENGGGMMPLDTKAVGTMTITNNFSGGTVTLSELETGLTRIQRRRAFLRQIMNVRGTNSATIVWTEQDSPEGGAGTTAEGSAKSQTDFNIVERSASVKKITAYIKVSKEMVADIPFMMGEINGELMELVELKLDDQLMSGNNTGANLNGILNSAQAFSPGTFALNVVEPNEADVLRVAIAQIARENFEANYIVLHPEDVAKMELTKTTAGEYTYPMFYVGTGSTPTIKGIPVVENTGITAGTYLVGDFTKSNVRIREDVNVSVGFENDDFTKNLMTVMCELRAVHYVKTNHVKAFVKGTFATDITAITKP